MNCILSIARRMRENSFDFFDARRFLAGEQQIDAPTEFDFDVVDTGRHFHRDLGFGPIAVTPLDFLVGAQSFHCLDPRTIFVTEIAAAAAKLDQIAYSEF